MLNTDGGPVIAQGAKPPLRAAPDPDILARIWEHLAAGEFPQAGVAMLEVMEGTEDANAQKWALYGYVLQQSGQYEPAVRACRAAIDRGMIDWSNYLMLGSSLKNLDRHEEAYEALAESQRLLPTRVDAALLFLEEAMTTRGLSAAKDLYEQMRTRIDDRSLEITWHNLLSAYIPPEVPGLLNEGKIEEAEAVLKVAHSELNSRRVTQWLYYLDRYKQWLEFTSRQWPRSDPHRKPSITILLISYKHERFIAAAIEGILKQKTDCRVEIHCVDDASPDGTQAVILDYARRYPDIVKPYFNPTNVGLLDPPQQKVTHKAFTRLNGDYTCILEGDDYWSDPNKLQMQIDFLEKNPVFAVAAHNTVKIYDDNSAEPHRFLHWHGIKPILTIDDAVQMKMFFHTSSVIYRNVLMMNPPDGFASKWSCDIFNTVAHLQYGDLRYFDEDMSVYRAHSGGLYSTMPQLKGRIFNLEGLMRYNAWLGFRYLKGYAFSLNRLTLLLLRETQDGVLPPLTWKQRLRYGAVSKMTGTVYDLLDKYPGLDPAVWRFGEPKKFSDPRHAKLADYGIFINR
jgi:glycosyltransferase involved in cell wall biosynthesis